MTHTLRFSAPAPRMAPPESASPTRAESLTLATQAALLRDFDAQMRHMGKQIALLSKAKRLYREKMARLAAFMAQNTNDARKDGKRTMKADFAQMADLCASFYGCELDLEKLTLREKPLELSANGEKQGLDGSGEAGKAWAPLRDGRMGAGDLRDYFLEGASIKDPSAAGAHAKLLGDDGTGLFAYHGHVNNRGENGLPLFDVFVEPMDRISERLQNELSAVEEKAESLGTRFSQVSAQRKAALDGMQQQIAKRERWNEQILGKS